MKRTAACVLILCTLGLGSVWAGEEGRDWKKVVESLKNEVRTLKDRVRELEAREGGAAIEVLSEGTLEEAIDRAAAANVSAPHMRALTITGQIRAQGEDMLDFDFDNDHGDANEFVRFRTRIAFDADISEKLRAFVKIQDSRFFGSEQGVLGNIRGVDLKEGYVDFRKLFADGLTLRVGRQELKYGSQKVISNLDWSEIGRSWDGLRLMYRGEGFVTHLFLTRISEKFLVDGQDESQDFLGLYNTIDAGEGRKVDIYILFRRNQDADVIMDEEGKGGHEQLWMLGGRFAGKADGFDFEAEAGWQLGDRAGDDIRAWMFELRGGYTFEDVDWKPRIGAAWIFASGDDDPGDGDWNTYDQLYTFGHYYLGYTDRVGRRNISSPEINLDLTPAPGVNLSVDYHLFWLDKEEQGLFNAGGMLIRAGDSHADSFVGSDLDVHVKAKLSKNVVLWAGWSHFFAGEFLDDTGSDDDADFFFIQVTVDF